MIRGSIFRLPAMVLLVLTFTEIVGAQAKPDVRGNGPGPRVGSEAEAVHNKLFSNEEAGAIPKKLSSSSGDVTIVGPRSFVDTVELGSEDDLLNLSCGRDLIVVATAGSAVSHMSAGKGALYSDWGFTINQIFKNNSKSPVSPDHVITIARPGGMVTFGNRKVHYSIPDFREFTSGEQYLLFLKAVPATGAYELADPHGFALPENKALPLGVHAGLPAGFTKSQLLQLMTNVTAKMAQFPNGDCPSLSHSDAPGVKK